MQKSVCVLSRIPVYGLLKIKLELITCTFFDQKNFKDTNILKNFYIELNASMKSLVSSNQLSSYYHMGLNLSDLVFQYQSKVLVLFKLLLLEKRILFYMQPVSKLSNTIASLISLLPDIFGLFYLACLLKINFLAIIRLLINIYPNRSRSTLPQVFIEFIRFERLERSPV